MKKVTSYFEVLVLSRAVDKLHHQIWKDSI